VRHKDEEGKKGTDRRREERRGLMRGRAMGGGRGCGLEVRGGGNGRYLPSLTTRRLDCCVDVVVQRMVWGWWSIPGPGQISLTAADREKLVKL